MVAVTILVVMGLIAISLTAWLVGIYNGLVRVQNNVGKAWSDIDVLLKQRHDEIPKLVQVCESYMKHERTTLQRVVEARNQAAKARNVGDVAQAEAGLAKALSGLFAVVEKYPELRSSEHLMGLQRRISRIEEQIADRREHYNAAANNYNIRIQEIPDVLVARSLNYTRRDLFQVTETDRQDVDVRMNVE